MLCRFACPKGDVRLFPFDPPPHRGVRYSPFWRTDYDGDRRRLVPLFDLMKNRPRPLKKKSQQYKQQQRNGGFVDIFFFICAFQYYTYTVRIL